MMTAYSKGQMIEAKTNAQGLRRGERYQITGVKMNPTPFGDFVTYTVASLRPEEPGFEWEVVNGHLILAPATGN